MRTVKVSWELKGDEDSYITIETEVIVGDDQEAEQAGAEAQEFISSFSAGMAAAAK